MGGINDYFRLFKEEDTGQSKLLPTVEEIIK